MINHFVFKKDATNKKILVERAFNAPLANVWAAWTDSAILDQWWAPKPWKAETKIMNFVPGGHWLYAMVGPDGKKEWCRVDFETIDVEKSFSYTATFCDKNGVSNLEFPVMHWTVNFIETSTGTQVNIEISFNKEADFERIIAMGFEGGFTMGLGNLNDLLSR